jgi:hypothetical protein
MQHTLTGLQLDNQQVHYASDLSDVTVDLSELALNDVFLIAWFPQFGTFPMRLRIDMFTY